MYNYRRLDWEQLIPITNPRELAYIILRIDLNTTGAKQFGACIASNNLMERRRRFNLFLRNYLSVDVRNTIQLWKRTDMSHYENIDKFELGYVDLFSLFEP
jgi:hypothetical protein